MKKKIAINGFGRIGRLTLRAFFAKKTEEFEISAINDLGNVESNIHLYKYDTVHGKCKERINNNSGTVTINNQEIKFLSEPNPSKLPWRDLDIDLVIESTGFFTDRNGAEKHLVAGAKKVLISAPAKDPDFTVVYGVNDNDLIDDHKIISNASCTTNCLAPLAYLLENSVGLESGYMTTVHSVTGDQNTIDTIHKDLRRARNSLISIIPTSTGAARAVGEVLPQLKGKIDGSAIRVPTSNVSLVDFKFLSKKETNEEELIKIFKDAEEGVLKSVLETTSEPLVSPDFNQNPHSSIVDLREIKVLNQKFCRVLSWYDNEWGFSNRLIDVAKKII